MNGWVLGWVIGAVLVVVVVVLLGLMIRGAARTAAKVEAIVEGLGQAEANTAALWAVATTNREATRIVAAATAAREHLTAKAGSR